MKAMVLARAAAMALALAHCGCATRGAETPGPESGVQGAAGEGGVDAAAARGCDGLDALVRTEDGAWALLDATTMAGCGAGQPCAGICAQGPAECEAGSAAGGGGEWAACYDGLSECLGTCLACSFPRLFSWPAPEGGDACACPEDFSWSAPAGGCLHFAVAYDMNGDDLEDEYQDAYVECYVARTQGLDPAGDAEAVAAAKKECTDEAKAKRKQHKTLMKEMTAYREAAIAGDLERMQELDAGEAAYVHAHDNEYRNALHYAAMNGHLAVVEYLVASGAVYRFPVTGGGVAPYLPPDAYGKTAIDHASEGGFAEIVGYLEKEMAGTAAEPP